MSARRPATGLSLLELAAALAVVIAILAVLLPVLATARRDSAREQCHSNLSRCGEAWSLFMEDHAERLPYVPIQPAWHVIGVRFSAVDGRPFLDTTRPLSSYLHGDDGASPPLDVLRCPADRGITGETSGVGTGERTAFRSFGTSYRGNAALLDAHQFGLIREPRALRRAEIRTAPSRLVIMGDPIWYEVHEKTDRDAAWHGDPDKGNLLFLDGAVKYMRILPKPRVGPAVYEPWLIEAVPPAP